MQWLSREKVTNQLEIPFSQSQHQHLDMNLTIETEWREMMMILWQWSKVLPCCRGRPKMIGSFSRWRQGMKLQGRMERWLLSDLHFDFPVLGRLLWLPNCFRHTHESSNLLIQALHSYSKCISFGSLIPLQPVHSSFLDVLSFRCSSFPSMSVRNTLHIVLWFAQFLSARSREQYVWNLHLHPMISLITSLISVTYFGHKPNHSKAV